MASRTLMRSVSRAIDPSGIFTGGDLMDQAAEAAREDDFGYFGTMGTNTGGRRRPVDAEVGQALLDLGASVASATEFLRSRMGRHLADAVCTTPTLAGKPVLQHVKEHLRWHRMEARS